MRRYSLQVVGGLTVTLFRGKVGHQSDGQRPAFLRIYFYINIIISNGYCWGGKINVRDSAIDRGDPDADWCVSDLAA